MLFCNELTIVQERMSDAVERVILFLDCIGMRKDMFINTLVNLHPQDIQHAVLGIGFYLGLSFYFPVLTGT